MRKLRHKEVKQIAQSHMVNKSGSGIWTQEVPLQSSVLFSLYQTPSLAYTNFLPKTWESWKRKVWSIYNPKHLESSANGIFLYSFVVSMNAYFYTGGISFYWVQKKINFMNSREFTSPVLSWCSCGFLSTYLNLVFRMFSEVELRVKENHL